MPLVNTYTHTVTVPAATAVEFDGAPDTSGLVFEMKRSVTGGITVVSGTVTKHFTGEEAQAIYSLFRKALEGTAENP